MPKNTTTGPIIYESALEGTRLATLERQLMGIPEPVYQNTDKEELVVESDMSITLYRFDSEGKISNSSIVSKEVYSDTLWT